MTRIRWTTALLNEVKRLADTGLTPAAVAAQLNMPGRSKSLHVTARKHGITFRSIKHERHAARMEHAARMVHTGNPGSETFRAREAAAELRREIAKAKAKAPTAPLYRGGPR